MFLHQHPPTTQTGTSLASGQLPSAGSPNLMAAVQYVSITNLGFLLKCCGIAWPYFGSVPKRVKCVPQHAKALDFLVQLKGSPETDFKVQSGAMHSGAVCGCKAHLDPWVFAPNRKPYMSSFFFVVRRRGNPNFVRLSAWTRAPETKTPAICNYLAG